MSDHQVATHISMMAELWKRRQRMEDMMIVVADKEVDEDFDGCSANCYRGRGGYGECCFLGVALRRYGKLTTIHIILKFA